MKPILRFFTAGHVDDGKSTLIGRLLYDSESLYEDHVIALRRDSGKKGCKEGALDFSLLTDGLRAEREQGITIDVSYRYFSTKSRKFILADSPGHEQYTRNMATAASNSDVLLLLIDAKRGIQTQTRRHALLASLLGVKHAVIAVNKMDAVDYSEEVFSNIQTEFSRFAHSLDFSQIFTIPVSALNGVNVVKKDSQIPWYKGHTIIEVLETMEVEKNALATQFRFPIQHVLRPEYGGRCYSGTVEAGVVNKGMELICLPSGQKSHVQTIYHSEKKVETATAGQAIVIELDREIDASRGSLFSSPESAPEPCAQLEATLIWLGNTPSDGSYALFHSNQLITARIDSILYKMDVHTLKPIEKQESLLNTNDIALVSIHLHRPIFPDSYKSNRNTGSFILIDSRTNQTVAAGLIQKKIQVSEKQQRESISMIDREKRLSQSGAVIWFTGLSGSGKSTISYALEKRLFELGKMSYVLDGDLIRKSLCQDLGYSLEDRRENVRRVASVASLYADTGLIAIVSLISPIRKDRELAKGSFPGGKFIEIHLSTPLAVCESRDPKGLYRKARMGEIGQFTGISSPYEPPLSPDLELDTSLMSCDECVDKIIAFLSL